MDRNDPKWQAFITDVQKGFTDLLLDKLEQHFGTPKTPETKPSAQAHSWTPTFPDDLGKLVKIEDDGSCFSISPIKFLGSENFSAILNIVKGYDGKYVKAAGPKQPGHFEIPKTTEEM